VDKSAPPAEIPKHDAHHSTTTITTIAIVIIDHVLESQGDDGPVPSTLRRHGHLGTATIEIHFIVVFVSEGWLDYMVFHQIRYTPTVDQVYF